MARMEKEKKRVPLKRRVVALLLVLAGVGCLIAGKSDTSAGTSPFLVAGIALMVGGIVVRLTGRR